MEILLVSMVLLNATLCLRTIRLSRQKTQVHLTESTPSIEAIEQKGIDAVVAFHSICSNLAAEYGLTSRENDVFYYLARGYNCQAIAEHLYVAPSTVKSHSYRIYRKMSIHSQQEIISIVERSLYRAPIQTSEARCA